MDGAVAGHVLVKNVNHSLPLGKPKMLSIFGYDAAAPPTKNVDSAFNSGSESVKQGVTVIAQQGTLISGGGSGANAPGYIDAVSTPPPTGVYRASRWSNTRS